MLCHRVERRERRVYGMSERPPKPPRVVVDAPPKHDSSSLSPTPAGRHRLPSSASRGSLISLSPRSHSSSTTWTTGSSKPMVQQQLKIKFVHNVEALFSLEADAKHDPLNFGPRFWDELFLLKVEEHFLIEFVRQVPHEDLEAIMDNVHVLFEKCLESLTDDHGVRRVENACLIMVCILKGLFSKKWNNFAFGVLQAICGFERADVFFSSLVDGLLHTIRSKASVRSVRYAVHALHTIVAACDNINQNALLEYLVRPNVFNCLLKALTEHDSGTSKGSKIANEIAFMFVVLVNYRKNEVHNKMLGIMNELHGPSLVPLIMYLTNAFHRWNESMPYQAPDDTLWDKMKSWFSPSASSHPSNGDGLDRTPTMKHEESEVMNMRMSLLKRIGKRIQMEMASPILLMYQLLNTNEHFLGTLLGTDMRNGGAQQYIFPPLIASFIRFLSIALRFPSCPFVRVSLFALRILLEDPRMADVLFATGIQNSISVLNGEVDELVLFKYDRKIPPIVPIFDLLEGASRRIIRKPLDYEWYQKLFVCIHRIMVHGARLRVRTPELRWNELWKCMVRIMRVVVLHTRNQPIMPAVPLLMGMAEVIDYVLLRGRRFLVSSEQFDHLFYELVRESRSLELMFTHLEKELHVALADESDASSDTSSEVFSSTMVGPPSPLADSASAFQWNLLAVRERLHNVQQIVSHFGARVRVASAETGAVDDGVEQALDTAVVMKIIREHADTLTLRAPPQPPSSSKGASSESVTRPKRSSSFQFLPLTDGVDEFDRYRENPHFVSYFQNVFRTYVQLHK